MRDTAQGEPQSALDSSDRPILYALIRHLEARTPHYEATGRELAEMEADPESPMPFSDEERAMYAAQNARPGLAKAMFNALAATRFAEREYAGSMIMILRSPIRLRTSTTPAIALSAPPHPNMALPLNGMVPLQRALTLNPTTIALLIVGDFDGAFFNHAIGLDVAQAQASGTAACRSPAGRCTRAEGRHEPSLSLVRKQDLPRGLGTARFPVGRGSAALEYLWRPGRLLVS